MNFEDLKADLVNHSIEGYLHTGERLSVPLISHIVEGLYVGGCVNGVDLGSTFDRIVSLYKWERYAYDFTKTELYEFTMYDSSGEVDGTTVELAANAALDALERGDKVLVHCQAGINRSNLVAAVVLMRLLDISANDAITMLREGRSHLVLANKTFENYLRALDN